MTALRTTWCRAFCSTNLVDFVQVKRVRAKIAAGAVVAEVVLVSPAICKAMMGASHREAHSMAQDLETFAEDKWEWKDC